jgi:hypothetical protein
MGKFDPKKHIPKLDIVNNNEQINDIELSEQDCGMAEKY